MSNNNSELESLILSHLNNLIDVQNKGVIKSSGNVGGNEVFIFEGDVTFLDKDLTKLVIDESSKGIDSFEKSDFLAESVYCPFVMMKIKASIINNIYESLTEVLLLNVVDDRHYLSQLLSCKHSNKVIILNKNAFKYLRLNNIKLEKTSNVLILPSKPNGVPSVKDGESLFIILSEPVLVNIIEVNVSHYRGVTKVNYKYETNDFIGSVEFFSSKINN